MISEDSDLTIRELAIEELPQAWELGRLAFGGPTTAPAWALREVADVTRYGAFDRAGRLLGKASDLHHEQWWGGSAVSAADIGGVAVVPEARGRGISRALLTAVLAGARARGAAVSALYPSVSAPYRSSGWELTGAVRTVDLATAELPRWPMPAEVAVRPGDRSDLSAVRELYDQIARHRCGMLTRRGGFFDELPETPLPADTDGLSVVEQDGRAVGALLWQRGQGYRQESVLTVRDVFAVSPAAARALVGVLAGWVSVAPTLRLPILDGDALSAALPLERAREHRTDAWMHRPVDVVRAVAARRWPCHVQGSVTFALSDPIAPWNAGTWRLDVAHGTGRLEPVDGDATLELSVRGFAALYCGVGSGAGVAHAGLLRVRPDGDPATLDLLAAGPPAQLLDYF